MYVPVNLPASGGRAPVVAGDVVYVEDVKGRIGAYRAH